MLLILQEGPSSSNTESEDGLSEEEELASANRAAAGRSAEAGGLAVSRSAEAGGLAVSRSGDPEEEEGEEEEDNLTSRERSGQQENDSRGREIIEAGDSALEEDVSEEEVGGGLRVSICFWQNIFYQPFSGINCWSVNFFVKTMKTKHHE